MIVEVGGEQLPHRVQVALGLRLVEAAYQGLVLLLILRHRSFLLLANSRFSPRVGKNIHDATRRRLAHRPEAIHRSAWNRNSRKFTVASYSSTQRQTLDNRPGSTPLASKRSDLVAVVTPFCIKGLRLATVQLPDKCSPMGPDLNRPSANRVSRTFVNERMRHRFIENSLQQAMVLPTTESAN